MRCKTENCYSTAKLDGYCYLHKLKSIDSADYDLHKHCIPKQKVVEVLAKERYKIENECYKYLRSSSPVKLEYNSIPQAIKVYSRRVRNHLKLEKRKKGDGSG